MLGIAREVTPEGHQLVVVATHNTISVTMYVGAEHRALVTIGADRTDERWWLNRALVTKESAREKGFGSIALKRLLKEIAGSLLPVIVVAPGGYRSNKVQQFNFYVKNGFKQIEDDGLFEWRRDEGPSP